MPESLQVKVKIHEVKCKELPELNDEFAQDVSEFDTLEEYKADVKKHLEVEKENEAKKTKEDEAIQKIIDKSTMEIPEAMIETQCENMVNDLLRDWHRAVFLWSSTCSSPV